MLKQHSSVILFLLLLEMAPCSRAGSQTQQFTACLATSKSVLLNISCCLNRQLNLAGWLQEKTVEFKEQVVDKTGLVVVCFFTTLSYSTFF